MLGKDISTIVYEEVMEDLETTRAKCAPSTNKTEEGCTQPQYKACKSQIYIMPREWLKGGTRASEPNFNIDPSVFMN